MSRLSCQTGIAITLFEDFLAHFEALELKSGTDILVASSLYAFGYIEGDPGAIIYEALRTILGPRSTIVVPTYEYHQLDDNALWNAETSPGMNMGLLSEHVRCHPQRVRSVCPIMSHAAIGPNADLLTRSLPTASCGPGSDFDILREANFDMVMLGCSFTRGCTYLHHVEALVGVPYRHWVKMPRKIMRSNSHEIEDIIIDFYDYSDPNLQDCFESVPKALNEQGALYTAPAPYGTSYHASLAPIDACGRDLLKQNPYSLVTKRLS